jgi:hypothetical protein
MQIKKIKHNKTRKQTLSLFYKSQSLRNLKFMKMKMMERIEMKAKMKMGIKILFLLVLKRIRCLKWKKNA